MISANSRANDMMVSLSRGAVEPEGPNSVGSRIGQALGRVGHKQTVHDERDDPFFAR